VFSALGGSGFGRCDLRMDSAGDVYFLEINPNCEIFCPEGQFGTADFLLANMPSGHSLFARHLIMCAFRRQARAARRWEIRYDRATGFGLYATRPIASGEVVEPYEERPRTVVSRNYVEKNWRQEARIVRPLRVAPLRGPLRCAEQQFLRLASAQTFL
jgi:hypothetical protein